MPKPLDLSSFSEPAVTEDQSIEKPWPSREPRREPEARAGAITIRTDSDAHVLERFKALCKEDRRTYTDMLRILIDEFENRRG
jgi:hypothetical protein